MRFIIQNEDSDDSIDDIRDDIRDHVNQKRIDKTSNEKNLSEFNEKKNKTYRLKDGSG